MQRGGENKIPNRLWLARKRRGLGQKQVASLLSHHTADQVSRYEKGARVPTLETALRLEIIYRTPVRVLFSDLYEVLREDLARKAEAKRILQVDESQNQRETEDDFCNYSDLLLTPAPSQADLDKVRGHATRLVRRMAYL